MSDIETKSESDFASDVKLDDIELNVQIVLLDIYKKMDKILDILNKLEMEATSVKAKVTPKELPSSSTTKATTSTPTCLGKNYKESSMQAQTFKRSEHSSLLFYSCFSTQKCV
ncbi:hypothetical protein DFJ73DRAFT_757166 [Zopfochytrium polystomum]|nr:hypothetical protein DFJ73DRAFT_757166 [Zopfochytrium polystomum]